MHFDSLAVLVHNLVKNPKLRLEIMKNENLNKNEVEAIERVFSKYSLRKSSLATSVGTLDYWA